jgi:P4 family phage/plasmid primase-like protien
LFEKGWSPIPLDDKKSLVDGVTGYSGAMVDEETLNRFVSEFGRAQVGIRLPKGFVAIDVDAYGDKPGAETLEELVGRLGPLPSTWVATARVLPSGKYIFRVPETAILMGKAGAGVDICQHHHRYVVCAPSVHASAGPVTWRNSVSWDECAIPFPSEIPWLPIPWLIELVKEYEGSPSCKPADSEQLNSFLVTNCVSTNPDALEVLVSGFVAKVDETQSRHDSLLPAVCEAMRQAAVGSFPAQDAVEKLREVWDAATSGEGRGREFDSAVAYAVGQIVNQGKPAKKGQKSKKAKSEAFFPETISEAGLAVSFLSVIQQRYLYAADDGGWLRFVAGCWQADATSSVLDEARLYVTGLYDRAEKKRSADSKTANPYKAYLTRAKIDAIATLTSRMAGITALAADFDTEPDLLCCANGVVNLRTSELLPHDPKSRHRMSTHVNYLPGATHPDVDRVFEVLDPGVSKYVTAVFGYSATGHVSEDLVVVFDGTGGNGKTTLLRAVSEALGDYSSHVSSKLILKASHNEHPTLFAALQHKRLALIEETPQGAPLQAETVKMLSGGSDIASRRLYGEFMTHEPTHQLFLGSNFRPVVNSGDAALWRRLRLVPFPHSYKSPEESGEGDRIQEVGLRERVSDKALKEATLAKVVAASADWYANGLPLCPEIDQASKQWRFEGDVLARFAADCLVFEPDGAVFLKDLYPAYRTWCAVEGETPLKDREFSSSFKAHLLFRVNCLTQIKSRDGVSFGGVSLVS